MARFVAGTFGIIAAVAIVVYGIFAIYEGSWSLTAHNTAHSLQIQRQIANGQAQNAQAGWNYQTMLGEQIVSGVKNVYDDTTSIDQYKQAGNTTMVADETGQRAFDAGQVCHLASEVNGTLPHSDPTTVWVDKNCSGGVLSINSVYYVK